MLYNYYLEGYSGGVFVRHYLEGYKSRGSAIRAAQRYKERFKIAEAGHVLFTFSSNEERKYNRTEYKIISQFNAKPYFEYWS